METVTEITGRELEGLIAALAGHHANPYKLRIAQMSDGTVKYKVNEGMWTPAVGRKDGGR